MSGSTAFSDFSSENDMHIKTGIRSKKYVEVTNYPWKLGKQGTVRLLYSNSK